jgi:3-hydroxybutyryl-CoA dehydratase
VDFERITIGLTSEWRKTVTETDVVLYAGITGDFNPVHVDAIAAAAGPFGGRIAHGMLTAGFISAAMANGVPGPGAVYLSQALAFRLPVHIGDTVTARVTVVEIKARTRRVRLATQCLNQRGEVVLDGEAMVLLPAPASADAPPAGAADAAPDEAASA